MATSPFRDTAFILEFINNLDPRSILDVGSGFGRWGFLCRCHFGSGISLLVKPDQPLRIDAVEAFAPNVSPAYPVVYDRTYTGDARAILPGLGTYDVVICSHMIEHLKKDEGWRLIEEMKKHSRMALILGLPFDDAIRDAIDGNEFERHQSVWRASDFGREPAWVSTFPFLREVWAGVVIYPLDVNARWHVKTMRSPLRTFAVRHLPGMLRAARRAVGSGGGK